MKNVKKKPSSPSLCISWLHVTTSNRSDICSQSIGPRTRRQFRAWKKDGEKLCGDRSSKYILMTLVDHSIHTMLLLYRSHSACDGGAVFKGSRWCENRRLTRMLCYETRI